MWGHCEAGAPASSLAVPGLRGAGVRAAAAQARAPGAGVTLSGGSPRGSVDSSPGLGLRDGARRCRRPARRCGAPQPARGRAYLGWPPPGPGTWSPRLRLPPGSSEPPAAARCSAAAAGHGAGRPPGAGPRAGAALAAPSRGAGERGPPASPPARPPSTLPPPPSRAEPPPSGLRAACARRSVCECVRGRVYVCV